MSKPTTLYAKALYDNTAESPDELAFCKGDLVAVLQQTVPGNKGWWRCSVHGKEGLAPANRLHLLSAAKSCTLPGRTQSIYQIPRASQPDTASPTYEVMERACEEHTTPVKHSPGDVPQKILNVQEVLRGNGSPRRMVYTTSRTKLDYDVPSVMRKGSWATMPSSRPSLQKAKTSADLLRNRYEVMGNCRPCQNTVSAVSTAALQDLNYDIPAPATGKLHQAAESSTLPNPSKPEWIYDVPQAIKKASEGSCYHRTSRSLCNKSADAPPAGLLSAPPSTIYDIPKASVTSQQSAHCIYDIPPAAKPMESPSDAAAPSQRKSLDALDRPGEPLEYRGKSGLVYDLPRGRPPWSVKPNDEHEGEKARRLPVPAGQRSSTASTSSSTSSSSRSSCDSLMFSSPSPEPEREIALSQEEVAQKLLQLQEAVCRAVPRLMDFVSSHWRCREHLRQHLQEIRAAAEAVADSLSGFLDFALDVRGNARRLTDSNLHSRLLKQLSIVEDSDLILQQAVNALGGLGWPLEELAQDPAQAQAPDQLERFVMVARTVPEDVKRLVSMLNANSKLLFRSASKEQEAAKDASSSDTCVNTGKKEPPLDLEGEDNDYVQLQTKMEFEEQQRMKEKEKDDKKTDTNREKEKKQVSKPQPGSPTNKSQTPGKTYTSDHCRLYFGALKKAIAVFVKSVEEEQPPEKFIGHSKLVIMVGQRLIDSLCCDIQGKDSQEILCKSSQLCALLKQLAVATKKAAVHFPDTVAMQEVRDFAKELFVWVQHFRFTLDI